MTCGAVCQFSEAMMAQRARAALSGTAISCTW
jgi:hypothetical protein